MMRANMNVETRTLDPVVFHLTGKKPSGALDGVEALRPALFAAYHDLTQLRYDYPVILVAGNSGGAPIRSLSGLIDGLLLKIAPPGIESEQLRKVVLRLEREIRTLAAAGKTGRLTKLWDEAVKRIESETDGSAAKFARIARAALDVDGEVVDCGATTANRVVTHVWATVQEDKARSFRANVSRLAIKLADIIRADFIRSEAGRSVDSLKSSIGPAHHTLFDFAAMSRLLPKSSSGESLPENRRRRVEWALSILKNQRFFAAASGQPQPSGAARPFSFVCESCADALSLYRARLPEMVELVKALAIAELEIDGAYLDAKHDSYFKGFDAGSLSSQDKALFPDYLVALGGTGKSTEYSGLMEALSSGVPLKVLVNVHDLAEDGGAPGAGSAGLRGAQLASLATGLGEVFVVQSSSSNLLQMRDQIAAGLVYRGPALFSVFSGAPTRSGSIAPYLLAAAAMQSRAFPAFTYNPAAGSELAVRYSIDSNPQPDRDWVTAPFEYADDQMQRVRQDLAFTFIDFLAGDPRYAGHFAKVSRAQWNDRMIPVADWLARDSAAASDAVPYIVALDGTNALVRAIADDRAVAAARRCLDAWHRLQEFGGVHNSYAERLLKRERAAWEVQKQRELEALQAEAKSVATGVAAPAAMQPETTAGAPEAKEAERSSDEAYIETTRCSSCNECIQINDRMFAYNENKQAYVANPDAGTYRQLVEAAENCQIGIIHPGKPRNKGEPGLDELMQRAEAFL